MTPNPSQNLAMRPLLPEDVPLLAAALKSEFSRTLPRPDDWDAAADVFASLEAEVRVTPEKVVRTVKALMQA